MNELLKNKLENVVPRCKAFYEANESGHFLVATHFNVDIPPGRSLGQFDLDNELESYLDLKITQAKAGWKAKEQIDDDMIPSICPWFGYAEHSAWLGQDVLMQEKTSLSLPMLKNPEDLDNLRLSEDTKWFQRMKKAYEILRKKNDGSYVLSVRGTMSPMDLANALRGDEIFVDFLLNPQFVHKLCEFMVKAIRWYYKHLCSWTDEISGGRIFIMSGSWMPNAIGHLSNDAAMLCSEDIYREFGLPYETQLVQGYSNVLYHVHNEKMHYLPDLVKLPNLSLLQVSQDPKTPWPLEDLDRIFSKVGNAKLLVNCTSHQVRSRINKLKEHNFFLSVLCDDQEDAKDIVKLIRKNSKN